jgi:DNA polymerase-3 subunit delta'
MRAIVATASRRPATGRWQIVVIEDADRLTEGAGNALLKVVEEPPPLTVFLLCAPSVDPEDIAITLRSRCRHVALVTPSADAIAGVLMERDGWALTRPGGRPPSAAAMSGGPGDWPPMRRPGPAGRGHWGWRETPPRPLAPMLRSRNWWLPPKRRPSP